MAEFGFKEVTLQNWLQPDPTYHGFCKISLTGEVLPMAAEDWIGPLVTPELSKAVPPDVRELFEAARGAMAYGYFFYPLWTLGAEQLLRVTEAALSHKCRDLGAPKSQRSFKDKIDWLENEKAISSTDKESLHRLRSLRNHTSHPTSQSILTPGIVIPLLRHIVVIINSLFKTE